MCYAGRFGIGSGICEQRKVLYMDVLILRSHGREGAVRSSRGRNTDFNEVTKRKFMLMNRTRKEKHKEIEAGTNRSAATNLRTRTVSSSGK